jgi:hypothetical protein
MLNLLPFVVLRRAGVNGLRLRRLFGAAEIIDRLCALEAERVRLAEPLCRFLEAAVGAGQSHSVTAQLLRLKRDIYNHRPIKYPPTPELDLALAARLSGNEENPVERYAALTSEHARLLQEGEAVFAADLAAARRTLKKCLLSHEFRKALALASPSLYQELDWYIQNDDAAPSRRMRQAELSLIRYYSRAAFKISPFSSFTRTRLIQLDEDAPVGRERTHIRRSVKLNRALIGSIAARIVSNEELGAYAPVEISGAFERCEGKLVVLRKRYSRALPARLRIPREEIVTFNEGALVAWVEEFFARSNGCVTLEQIAEALGKVLPGDPYGTLRRLIEVGFLSHRIPLPDRESAGAPALKRFLSGIPGDTASALSQRLTDLEEIETRYPRARPRERLELSQSGQRIASMAFEGLVDNSAASWEGLLLFEDCIEEPALKYAPPGEWRPVLDDVKTALATYAPLFDYNLSVRMSMDTLVRKDFGGGPVSIVTFLRRWRSILADPQFSRSDNLRHTPNLLGLEPVSQLAGLRAEMGAIFAAPSDEEEIDLGKLDGKYGWTDRFMALGLSQHRASDGSASCYCQPFTRPTGEPAVVINGFDTGPFRAALRSCTATSPGPARQRIVDDVREALRERWPERNLYELASTYDFNPNLHPRLTDELVDCADEFIGESDMTRLNDLTLAIDNDDRLRIVNTKLGQPVRLLDMGITAMSFAPLTHHLLTSVDNISWISLKLFHPFFWAPRSSVAAVETYPRLVLGRCILRRRGWVISRDHLPVRAPAESDFAYFMKIWRWRRDLGLPVEVFISLGAFFDWVLEKGSGRKLWNSRKPQYVHFGNYLLVRVFEKLVSEARTPVYIEEMLPAEQTWGTAGSTRPFELVLDFAMDSGRMPEPARAERDESCLAGRSL